MPSGPELLRLHKAASLYRSMPDVKVVLVHPEDTAVMRMMVDELILRGVKRGSIDTVMHGTSTREQSLALTSRMDRSGALAIVTAPENMYRSIRTFRKAGFSNVCGVPAFDHAMFVDLDYDHKRIGGNLLVPDVSEELSLRYTFWNYLKLEITCLREYVAIAYYWMNGWI